MTALNPGVSKPETVIQLPSYEDLRKAGQFVDRSQAARRLCWAVNGPLTDAISVIEKPWIDQDTVAEPYYRHESAAGNASSWHPVSQCPYTEPKVSSVTVTVSPLNEWERQWFELHEEHTELDFPDLDPKEVVYGSLSNFDPERDEEGLEHLLRCCGLDRPRDKRARLVVKATGAFVTVHDYVSTVHPWLMSLREDCLAALGVFDEKSLPAETKLMVAWQGGPQEVAIREETTWIRHSGKRLDYGLLPRRRA